MKRISCLLLAVALACAAGACSGSSKKTTENPVDNSGATGDGKPQADGSGGGGGATPVTGGDEPCPDAPPCGG